MKKQNNSIFITITGILIAIGRLLLGQIKDFPQKDNVVLIVMAVVNYIALAVVLLFINSDLIKYCNEKITKAGINTNSKKKRKKILNMLSIIYSFIYLIMGYLYLKYFKSGDLNDALSIIALALSITANNLVNDLSSLYYKFIVCLSSIHIKKEK